MTRHLLSGMVGEWLDCDTDHAPAQVGKTLNMSMVECFSQTGMQAGVICLKALHLEEAFSYRQLQGTFPVIFLSLRI